MIIIVIVKGKLSQAKHHTHGKGKAITSKTIYCKSSWTKPIVKDSTHNAERPISKVKIIWKISTFSFKDY